METSVSKKEWMYILYAGGFALVWFVWLIPNLGSFGFISSSPYMTFLLFNVGIVVLLQIIIKSIAINAKIDYKAALGVILLVVAIDVWQPPFAVSQTGELLSGLTLSTSSSDYIFGYMLQSFGMQGFMVYIGVYMVIPILLLIIASRLLPNFVRHL